MILPLILSTIGIRLSVVVAVLLLSFALGVLLAIVHLAHYRHPLDWYEPGQ